MSATLDRVLKPLKDEAARQKAEKQKRRADWKNIDMVSFIGRWIKRFFYTVCFVMIAYVIVIGGTIMVPTVMGYLIGSMGYTVSNNAEMLLSLLSGLFFGGWTFLISFFIIRFAWNRYINGIKHTFPDDILKDAGVSV